MAKLKTQIQAPAPEEIEFKEALPAQQNDDDLKAPMRTLRNGKPIPTSYPIKEKPVKTARRPKGTKNAKLFISIEKPKGVKRQPQASASYSNTYICNKKDIDTDNKDNIVNNINEIDKVSIKDKLTSQELRFLEIYFSSDHIKGTNKVTTDKAMILAGYGHFTQDWRYKLAKKIVIKYERCGGEATKIFQELGFGQIKVAQGIIDKAENAKSEMVSLKALALAAKCCRMTEEKERTGQGININIITTAAAAPGGPSPGPGPAQVVIQGEAPAQPVAPRKPLQITR